MSKPIQSSLVIAPRFEAELLQWQGSPALPGNHSLCMVGPESFLQLLSAVFASWQGRCCRNKICSVFQLILHHICHYMCQRNETLGVLYPLLVQQNLKKCRVDFCVVQVKFFRDKNIKIGGKKKKAFTASGGSRAAAQPDQALGIR